MAGTKVGVETGTRTSTGMTTSTGMGAKFGVGTGSRIEVRVAGRESVGPTKREKSGSEDARGEVIMPSSDQKPQQPQDPTPQQYPTPQQDLHIMLRFRAHGRGEVKGCKKP